jgi:hypothetical protein
MGVSYEQQMWFFVPPLGMGDAVPLQRFPVCIGSGVECAIRLHVPGLASRQVEIAAKRQDLVVGDVSGSASLCCGGKVVDSTVVDHRLGAVRVAAGPFAFLLCYGTAADAERHRQRLLPAVPHPPPLLPPEPGTERPAPLGDGPGPGPNPEGGEITCPHCWWEFGLGKMLAVARGPNQMGDAVLGRNEYRRYLPTRFAGNGNPLDPDGAESREWACPRCHLVLPSTLRTVRTFFLSIVGAGACGKSYFLAAMSWRLKELMPAKFGCEFLDLDVRANAWLSQYEEVLFQAVDEDAPHKINKTALRGDQYRPVMLGEQEVLLPRPCLFKVKPFENATPPGVADDASRLVVCYDNAGEHFQPEHDSAAEPGTEHIARAGGIVFMVDPILDVGLRRAVLHSGGVVASTLPAYPQHNLLNETFNRIQRLRGVGAGASASGLYEKPFIVCLSKADVFPAEFDLSLEPWVWSAEHGVYALDMARLVAMSYRVRAFLSRHAHRIVQTVEGHARHVLYVPVSGLGHCPGRHRESGQGGVVVEGFSESVRPRDVRPGWVEVPLLYMLATLGDILSVRGAEPEALPIEQYHVKGRVLRAVLPGRAEPLDIPVCYGGYVIQVPGEQTWLRVPQIEGVESL